MWDLSICNYDKAKEFFAVPKMKKFANVTPLMVIVIVITKNKNKNGIIYKFVS